MIWVYVAAFGLTIAAFFTLSMTPALAIAVLVTVCALTLLTSALTFRTYAGVNRVERNDSRSFSLGLLILSLGLLLSFFGRLSGIYSRFDGSSIQLLTLEDKTFFYFLAIWFNTFWVPALSLAISELLKNLRGEVNIPGWLDILVYAGAILSCLFSVYVLAIGLLESPERALSLALLQAAANTLVVLIVSITAAVAARNASSALTLRALTAAAFLTIGSVLATALLPDGAGLNTLTSDMIFVLAWAGVYSAVFAYANHRLPFGSPAKSRSARPAR